MTPTARARILFLTPRFPFPPDRGDRLHAFHLIRVFSERFQVTVATYEDRGAKIAEGKGILESWGARVLIQPLPLAGRLLRLGGALFTSRPLQIAYYDDPAMKRRLRREAGVEAPFDAVVCHLVRTAPLAAVARARVRAISLCDSLGLGLRRRLRRAPLLERPSVWLEAGRIQTYEANVLRSFDEGWLVSDVDRQGFVEGAERLRVIPNGVAEELFQAPLPADPPGVIGFHGHLGVPHNVDAAVTLVRHVFPVLRARGVSVRVRLIGSDPAPAVRELARVPGVEVAGYTTDLVGAIQGLRVLCAPLRFSSGLQNKIVEALAAGVPVVSSPEAILALGVGAPRTARAADTPGEYADLVQELWERTPDRLEELQAARAWIRERFSWRAYANRLQALLEEHAVPQRAP